jgi:hypothetical protein
MAMQFDDLPEGWFSPEDIAAYAGLYEQVPPGSSVAELGVWQGRSLCSVAEAIRRKNLRVHAVDTFLGTPRERDIVHDCGGNCGRGSRQTWPGSGSSIMSSSTPVQPIWSHGEWTPRA